MPGRRHSRRSPEEYQSTQVHYIFPGGLDGASALPSPVPHDYHRRGSSSDCPRTLFFNDSFSAKWGAQSFTLTYLPIPKSEHVFLCRGLYGSYQREELAWTREGGSKTINVLVGMQTQPGDTVVVEYAHYEQAPTPTPPKCGKVYEPIVLMPSATLSFGGKVPPGNDDLWLPAAAGFPVVPSPSNPSNLTASDSWGAYDTTNASGSTAEYTVSVGPGLAPGSSYSRHVSNKSLGLGAGSSTGVAHYLNIYCGDTNPRWSEATHVNISAYYASTDINPARFQAGVYLGFSTYYGSRSYGVYVEQRAESPRTWRISYTVNTPTGNTSKIVDIPHLGDNWTPGTHFIGLELDFVNASIEVTTDSGSYTYQNPDVAYDFSGETNYTPFRPKLEVYTGQFYSTNGVGTVQTNSIDGFTLASDVPYCRW